MRKLVFIFITVLLSSFAIAQKDSVYSGERTPEKGKEKRPRDPSALREKLFFGGNFNAVFGTYTIINLNPIIGYRVTEKFHIGGGGIFNYYSVNYSGTRISQSFYGSHTFARYFVLNNLFAQVQYDRLFQPKINFTTNTLEKGWVDYVLVGGGLRQPLGDRAFFVASLLYNINSNPNQISAYYNPVIQVGIVAGF